VSSGAPGAAELEAALASLERIAERVEEGRALFHRSDDRQLTMVFLWTNVGSQLKQFCRLLDIPAGTEPFAGPIRMRDKLVYGSVQSIDPVVIWDTCVVNGPELHELVSDLLAAL
jgi:hypothetical protein